MRLGATLPPPHPRKDSAQSLLPGTRRHGAPPGAVGGVAGRLMCCAACSESVAPPSAVPCVWRARRAAPVQQGRMCLAQQRSRAPRAQRAACMQAPARVGAGPAAAVRAWHPCCCAPLACCTAHVLQGGRRTTLPTPLGLLAAEPLHLPAAKANGFCPGSRGASLTLLNALRAVAQARQEMQAAGTHVRRWGERARNASAVAGQAVAVLNPLRRLGQKDGAPERRGFVSGLPNGNVAGDMLR